MKKWLLLSSSIIPFVLVSCTQTPKKDTPTNENTNVLDALNSYLFTNDKTTQKQYYLEQNAISKNLFLELNYALYWFPLYYISSQNRNDSFANLTLSSKKIIENALTKNWYWFLKNITRFEFVLNPYGDKFQSSDLENAIFEKGNKDKKILLNIKDNLQKVIIKDFALPNSTNQLSNTKFVYFLFGDNKVVSAVLYNKDNINFFNLTGDVLEFEGKLSINEIQKQLDSIQNSMIQIYQQKIKEEIDYLKLLDSSEEEINLFLTSVNDLNFFKLFTLNGYNQIISQTFQELFDKNIFSRYTLRKVNYD
ncbi:aromatic motif membrane protein [Mycoplasmopsis columboralis]|uniref:Lipoprotein n=1 Tax=Mycoplasmopsis columboralis TaxID=171282 RepID=A0A449B6U1_9BACT|nr:aromatic motif membrane protein [Mycoplasmopsis columboralis]VEU76314.1 Uncharacterised protein [Mycoplasmopsis columboralis]